MIAAITLDIGAVILAGGLACFLALGFHAILARMIAHRSRRVTRLRAENEALRRTLEDLRGGRP
tara:strand:+ start:345 stop:536 length:192 start_codon:yes stop_codon:yes gene_type:complete